MVYLYIIYYDEIIYISYKQFRDTARNLTRHFMLSNLHSSCLLSDLVLLHHNGQTQFTFKLQNINYCTVAVKFDKVQ